MDRGRTLSGVLFLGDRSPYGLSVALALLDSPFRIAKVIVPSDRAYESRRPRAAGGRGVAVRLRSAAARAGGLVRRARGPFPAGEAMSPVDLDPGVTAERLQESFERAGAAWERVDGIGSEEFLRQRRHDSVDLFLCAAFPFIFGEALLMTPPMGCVNFHPSLLPRCRGCHPIFWTLASGETQGGVTAHFMTPEVDAGNIIAQTALPLTEDDDYGSLYRRAMTASHRLVALVAEAFRSGRCDGWPQDHSRATYHHEDTEEDHRVRWAGRSAAEVVALSRTGEAFAMLRGERLGILKAAQQHGAHRDPGSPPGTIISVGDHSFVVAAAWGAVTIHAASWRGRRCAAGDLARALGLRRGEEIG